MFSSPPVNLAAPGPIGGTTPAAITVTELTVTTSFTANSGTTFIYSGTAAAAHRVALGLTGLIRITRFSVAR